MSFVDTRRRLLSGIFIVIIIATVLVYGYLKAENLIRGPIISVEYPHDGENISGDTVIIKGKARNVSHFYLNDRPIFIDQKGVFQEALTILPGYTIVTIRGEDRFGKKTEMSIRLGKEGPLTSTSTPSS